MINLTGALSMSHPPGAEGIEVIKDIYKPNKIIKCCIRFKNDKRKIIQLKVRIDNEKELEYIKNGGILPYIFKEICKKKNKVESFNNI